MADGPVGVIFEAAEDSIITGVDYALKSFRLWNPKIDETDRPMDGVVEMDQLIEGRRLDEDVFGDRILTYTVPGQILLSGGAVVLNQPFALRTWVEQGGDVIIDRAGWGQIKGEIEVYSTIQGNIGDYLDLEAPHQVNAKVAQSPVGQRGGTRVVQIIGRTEKAGTSVLQLLDAGNLAQDPPIAPDPGTGGNDPNDGIPIPDLSLAPSVSSPLTIAVVTVDNATDITPLGGNVDLQYLVQVATPDPTDNGAPWGPVLTSQGIDELDLPEIQSGQTIWVRGQTFLPSTQQRSDWSPWIPILLGPDDDGSGGVLPPINLELTIDEDGVVDAAATGIAAITKVYFEPGTPNGAAPTYAETLAGTLDSSAPFAVPSIITLTEGQSVTVGAIGEDALGNRTILVTETIRFGVDTGSGAGTPGDAFITMYSGPPVEITVGDDPTEHEELDVGRFFYNTGNIGSARLQVGVKPVGVGGGKLALRYSANTGVTWRFCDAAQTGPFVDLTNEGFPVPGDYLLTDDGDFAGANRLFGVVSYDGADYYSVEVGNIFVQFNRATSPPPTEEPPPEIPGPSAGLVAYWALTEGSGDFVASKEPAPTGPDLVLGNTAGSTDGFEALWTTGPRRLQSFPRPFETGNFRIAHLPAADMVSLAAGSALFLYADMTSKGTTGKYLCGVRTGGVDDHYLTIGHPSPTISITVNDDPSNSPTSATSTSTLANGGVAYIGFKHDAAANTLAVYFNPVDGLPEQTVSLGTALEVGGRYLVIGAGGLPTTGESGPDSWYWGDPVFYAGVDVANLTPARIAELYAAAKLTYPALP